MAASRLFLPLLQLLLLASRALAASNSTASNSTSSSSDFCLDCGFDFHWALGSLSNKQTGILLVVCITLLCGGLCAVAACAICMARRDAAPKADSAGAYSSI